MRRRRGDLQLFSVSFLDVLACALGGVLLLLMLNMDASATKARSDAAALKALDARLVQASSALARAEDARQKAEAAADDAQRRARLEQQAREEFEHAQAALIGLEGDMEGVVFVFDTSGSMAETGRFPNYQSLLENWILHIPFERFNVIDFSNHIRVWHADSLVDGTPSNRQAAVRFVEGFATGGRTNTLAALQAAFALPGVDTIVLMSDGRPEVTGNPRGDMLAVRGFLRRANASRRVTINCVAMGNYFGKEYGEFLQQIASEHGGMFIGR